MQGNGQKRSQAEQSKGVRFMRLGHYGGAQSQAIDQGMQREARRQAEPAEGMLAGRVVVVLVVVFAWPRMVMLGEVARIAMLVGMDVKDSDKQEHREQTAQHPSGEPIDRALLSQRMRHEMQDRHAEH